MYKSGEKIVCVSDIVTIDKYKIKSDILKINNIYTVSQEIDERIVLCEFENKQGYIVPSFNKKLFVTLKKH